MDAKQKAAGDAEARAGREADWHVGVVGRVKALLEEIGLSQNQFAEELAQATDSKATTIKAYFKSKTKRKFTAYAIWETAQFLGVDIGYFFLDNMPVKEALLRDQYADHLYTKKQNERLQAEVIRLTKSKR